MACDCEIYECLGIAPRAFQCGGDIATTLLSSDTGIWIMQYEFNGRWFSEDITVANNTLVEIPNVFNENYNHTIRFYDDGGTLVNDTCYTLDMSQVVVDYGGSPSDSGNDGMLGTVTIDEDGATTFEVPAGRTVWIVFNGVQSPVRNVGFTQSGTTITMINGDTFYNGQQILYMYL